MKYESIDFQSIHLKEIQFQYEEPTGEGESIGKFSIYRVIDVEGVKVPDYRSIPAYCYSAYQSMLIDEVKHSHARIVKDHINPTEASLQLHEELLRSIEIPNQNPPSRFIDLERIEYQSEITSLNNQLRFYRSSAARAFKMLDMLERWTYVEDLATH